MIAFKHPEPFENKILFCDIIGYSRMPPLEQSAALRTLNAAVEGVLKDIDAALENSVIALPTGDGMALNFNTSDPIVHLRAALRLLELLEEQARNFGIRIGLNSDVDNCVIDINGKRNVVGNGINTAQRIMDLGGDGQVLMNAKLLPVLQNYGDFRHHAKHVGLFLVKHGVMIEIAQYADPNLSFVSCEPVAAEKRKPTRRSFADLVRARSHGGIIGLDLNPDAASGLEIVENHIVSTLSDVPDLASLSIVTGWIAREMLDNAFRYGRVGEFEPITLMLDRSERGVVVAVEQTDRPLFSLSDALADSSASGSFLSLLHNAGMRWLLARTADRMQISIEVPLDYRLPTIARMPDEDRVNGFYDVTPPFLRIDDINAAKFEQWMIEQVHHAGAEGLSLRVHLDRISYLPSRGLRALAKAKRAAGDIPIHLADVAEVLAEIFVISRYDMLFTIEPRESS